MTTKDNLATWNALCETDPAHTKLVSFGRQFTAIDPMYQIQRFTEQFGPIGSGWTWDAKHGQDQLDDVTIMAWSDVTLCVYGEMTYGPIRGASLLRNVNSKGKTVYDHDAWKKATTDALTKLMSHTGLGADVFLGKFDDNKYVQELRDKATKRVLEDTNKLVDTIINEFNQAEDVKQIETITDKYRDDFERMKTDKNARVFARRISGTKQRRLEELEGASNE